MAEKRLSADTLNFSAASSSVKKGETLVDTVNNILAMKVDMLVIRHPDAGAATFLSNHIDEKIQRVSSINEDDNLKELIDKSKMKAMQKEIKLLEKRKGKMEKMYEKMCGKKYRKAEMVDEMDAVSWNEKNNSTRGAAGERDPKKVGQSTSDYAINK